MVDKTAKVVKNGKDYAVEKAADGKEFAAEKRAEAKKRHQQHQAEQKSIGLNTQAGVNVGNSSIRAQTGLNADRKQAQAGANVGVKVLGVNANVNTNAKVGTNSGTSWENAYTNLQDALNNPRATEIWVAQGIYSSPKEGFLIDGFGALGIVLGGFIGNETAVSQRDIDNNITILESSSESSVSHASIVTGKQIGRAHV